MAARTDDVAMAVQRRYALAGERRRLLTRVLHGELAATGTPRRVPSGTRELELTEPRPCAPTRPGLSAGIDQLRRAAAACRAQAIALASRLAVLEPLRGELGAVRAQLLASSARLDHAVDHAVAGIAGLTYAPLPRASLRP